VHSSPFGDDTRTTAAPISLIITSSIALFANLAEIVVFQFESKIDQDKDLDATKKLNEHEGVTRQDRQV